MRQSFVENVLPARGPYFPNFSTPMQRGTSPLECWYSGVVNQTAYSTGLATFDQIFAYAVVIGRAGFLDRIAFDVTAGGGAGSKGRAAIYRPTSDKNLYPNELVIDGGEFDTTTIAVKSATINTFVRPGLYWFCVRFGVATPTVRSGVVGSIGPVLGIPATMGANANSILNVASAYAAFPATFPAGAGPVSSTARLVHVRFAS